MSERHTGLNSYSLRLNNGEYIYNAITKSHGYDASSAAVWLWEPEHAPRLAMELGLTIGLGGVMAVRARP